jgi:hypothetical protein
LWNTTYLQRAVDHLKRQGYHPTPGDLAHLSPLGWEHINLTGDYHWETSSTLVPDQFIARDEVHDRARRHAELGRRVRDRNPSDLLTSW